MVIEISDTVRCKPEALPFLDLSRQQLQRLFDAYTILESFSLTKIEFRRIIHLSFVKCCNLDDVDKNIAHSADNLFDLFDVHGRDVVDSLELLSAIALLNRHLPLEEKLRFVLGLYEFEYPTVKKASETQVQVQVQVHVDGDEKEVKKVPNQAPTVEREESFFTIEQVSLSFRASALGLGKLSNLWMDHPPDLDEIGEIARMTFSYSTCRATDKQHCTTYISFDTLLSNCIRIPEMKWLRHLDDVVVETDK